MIDGGDDNYNNLTRLIIALETNDFRGVHGDKNRIILELLQDYKKLLDNGTDITELQDDISNISDDLDDEVRRHQASLQILHNLKDQIHNFLEHGQFNEDDDIL